MILCFTSLGISQTNMKKKDTLKLITELHYSLRSHLIDAGHAEMLYWLAYTLRQLNKNWGSMY
jgi:hypothetical protein